MSGNNRFRLCSAQRGDLQLTIRLAKVTCAISIMFLLIVHAAYASDDTKDTEGQSKAESPPLQTVRTQDEKFKIPSSANSEWQKFCVDDSLNLNGDFQSAKSIFGLVDGQWSVGPTVSTQLIKYDMAKKQAGFNASVGAGASFRFYRPIRIKDGPKVFIGQVRTECRQTSFGWDRNSYRASPLFSITPTLYATKPTSAGDLAIQPAIVLGFFEDVLNFGVGFNLTGPPEEKGHVFLLMSIGTGFSF